MSRVFLYDTTLRDGSQGEGISFSASDKMQIARRLDEFGIHYIEGGFPGANPKDIEFFQSASKHRWMNAKLVAFGATRRKNTAVEDDAALAAILESGVSAAAIVAKFSRWQAEQVLETTAEENLAMIRDTVSYLKQRGLEVIVDAEHYFDGHKSDSHYARSCLDAAAGAGADWIVLCDTNGGSLVEDVRKMTEIAVDLSPVPIGIHTHNDMDLATAGSLAGVIGGATQIQGTINGLGERCGNANLCAVVANLQLKMGIECVSTENLARLTELSHFVSETANLAPNSQMAYVGHSAFAHKAGYHASATAKVEHAYQHVDPALVGNRQRILISELSGAGNVMARTEQFGIKQSKTAAAKTAETLKLLESQGFQFEGAEASFELLVRRQEPDYQPPFELLDFLTLVETRGGDAAVSEAMVKIRVGDDVFHTAAEGNGPVSALDAGTRKALLNAYPALDSVRLVDYKVRIVDSDSGTDASTRVLIDSTNGQEFWSTVGSSTNVVEASWLALSDSFEYAIMLEENRVRGKSK